MYQKKHEETYAQNFSTGILTSVVGISECKVNKLQDGPLPPTPRDNTQSFWESLATWGGTWMWDDIDSGAHSKVDVSWIAEGMTKRLLIWTSDGSYDRNKAVDLSGAGWIIFCKNTGWQMGACRYLFLCVFVLFLEKFALQSSFFSGPDCLQGLFFVFCSKSGSVGQPIDPDFFCYPDFCFVLFQIFMYSSIGSILWEAAVGRLAAVGVDGWGRGRGRGQGQRRGQG
jgi:hypothetical protein